MCTADSLEKSLLLGKMGGQKEKRASEDEMVGWHHQYKGHEPGQTSGDGEGQRGLTCCSPWGRKESDTTGQLNNNKYIVKEEEKAVKRILKLLKPRHTVGLKRNNRGMGRFLT